MAFKTKLPANYVARIILAVLAFFASAFAWWLIVFIFKFLWNLTINAWNII